MDTHSIMYNFKKPCDTKVKENNSDDSGYDYDNRFYSLLNNEQIEDMPSE